MRLPKLHLEVNESPKVTPYGGLALVAAFLKRFKVAERIDSKVSVLKQYQPYHESDHILAQALNLYVGGTCLEDLSHLQHSEAVRRLLGACRIPDPTTAGDFLRRFDESTNPGSLEALRQVIDELQCAVWKVKAKRTKKNKGKHKSQKSGHILEAIDMDGHIKRVYGVQKEGADFSHTKVWSFKPLLISKAGTGECLAVRNRSGNVKDPTGAAEALDEVLRYARPHLGKHVVVRGDSAFDQQDIRKTCEQHNVYTAIVGRSNPARMLDALLLSEEDWKPLQTRAARMADERRQSPTYCPRKKKPNLKRKRARERGYKDKRLIAQWVAEVPCQPAGADKPYRMIIRRKLIEKSQGQEVLFQDYHYSFLITDVPKSIASTEYGVDLTYERCDHENVIEQMGSGIPCWRMPVREFDGNCAWLEIARLAWNLAKWLALLALPDEVVRWEWKRFRHAFVYLAAEVVKRSRQTWLRFHGAHRFLDLVLIAERRLLL